MKFKTTEELVKHYEPLLNGVKDHCDIFLHDDALIKTLDWLKLFEVQCDGFKFENAVCVNDAYAFVLRKRGRILLFTREGPPRIANMFKGHWLDKDGYASQWMASTCPVKILWNL